jgi:hypothetical protein
MTQLIFLLGAFSTFFSCVASYGYKMHGYLGKMTDSYLERYEPELYNKVITLFEGQTISSVSSWADKIKRNPKYSWTKDLHFIDILECHTQKYNKDVIDKYCNNHCIVSALQDFTNSIKYNFKYDYIINEDTKLTNVELLKFLIHFSQDYSQPMHLLGYDRGGNGFKVNVFIDGRNRTSNLHFIWDSMLPQYFVDNYAYTFENKRYSKPDNYYELIENVLNDNIQISCRIYPDSHYIIFNDYFNENHFVTLFDNYQYLIVSTLKYIFEV